MLKPTSYNNKLYEGVGAGQLYNIFVVSYSLQGGISGSILFNNTEYPVNDSDFWTYFVNETKVEPVSFYSGSDLYYGFVAKKYPYLIMRISFTLPPLILTDTIMCEIFTQTMQFTYCVDMSKYSEKYSNYNYTFRSAYNSQYLITDNDMLALYFPVIESHYIQGLLIAHNGTDHFYHFNITFYKCDNNCETCLDLSKEKIEQKHCSKCKENFLYYEGANLSCRSLDEFASNSYLLVKDQGYDVIKPCDSTCMTCSETTTNCTQCADGHALLSHYINHPTKCYPVAQIYIDSYEYDSETNTFVCKYSSFRFNEDTGQYECISVCLEGHDYIMLSTNECVSSCFEYNLYVYMNYCVETCPKNSILNTETLICESEYNDKITNSTIEETIIHIDNIITDYSSSLHNETLTIQGNNYTLQIVNTTTSQDANAPIRNDISTIYLGKCEDILRKHYNIKSNETLLIVKLDIIQDDSVTNKVEYAVYDIKGNQLDLSLCMNRDITIEITYPLNPEYFDDIDIEFAEEMMNDRGIDLYNMNDTFFNDICMTYSTENNTDVVIKDRRNDYFVNISLCEKNCLYQGVNYTTKQVVCLCKVDKDIDYDNEIEYEPSFTKEFFTVIKYSFNFDFLKCYAHLYTFNNLQSNIGFWIMSCIIIINIICVMVFFHIDLPKFYIKLFFQDKQSKTSLNANVNNDNSNNHNIQSYMKHNVSEIKEENDESNDSKSINSDKCSEMHLQKHNNCTSSTSLQNAKTIHANDESIPSLHVINNNNNNNNAPFPNPPSRSTFTSSLFNEKLKHKSSPLNKHLQYLRRTSTFHTQVIKIQNEINSLPFKLAVNDDKRKCLGMFFNIVGRKFDLINIVIFRCEFDSISLCISSFLLSFTLDLFFGAMLFNDDIISKRYVNGGSLGFLTDSFISLLTKVFTLIMNFIIKKLTVYEVAIELLKSKYIYDDKYELKCYQCMKVCKKKLICFYLFNFLLLLGTWYYLALFCSVYKQSQMNWFEDCLLGNAFQIVFIVTLVLLVALLRYLAIKYKSKKMYNASLYLNQKC